MGDFIHQMFSLEGKHAIVTGAGQGIGRSIAEAYVAAGAKVALLGRSDKVKRACEQIDPSGSMAFPVIADLEKQDELLRAVDAMSEAFDGRIDILVNNAGIQIRHRPEDFPFEDWNRVVAVNLNAVWLMCQNVGRIMLKQGSGKIINIASMNSFFGGLTIPAYTACKHGVAGITKALSNDWAKAGLCVNAIAPGYIATDLNTALIGNPNREPMILARIAKGRWGTPEDIRGAAVFLASRASDYMSGAIVSVDGGYMNT